MNVYVDSSVLLRVVLGEPGRLRIWSRIARPVSSEMIRVECLRTIDRARLRFDLPSAEVAERRGAVLEAIDAFDLVPLEPSVLARAADPFPTSLGTLDALHLASALAAREEIPELAVGTHDDEFALAARAVGFRVFGTRR